MRILYLSKDSSLEDPQIQVVSFLQSEVTEKVICHSVILEGPKKYIVSAVSGHLNSSNANNLWQSFLAHSDVKRVWDMQIYYLILSQYAGFKYMDLNEKAIYNAYLTVCDFDADTIPL